MKTYILLMLCALAGISRAQEIFQSFLPEVTPAQTLDSFSLNELQRIVRANPQDFRQAYFSYGYEDSTEWEFVSSYILDYPDLGKPEAKRLDLNSDGQQDLLISFTGENYYSRLFIYYANKDRYDNVYSGYNPLLGTYNNGDLCLIQAACCADPTTAFFRAELKQNGNLIYTDSLAISSWRMGNETADSEILYKNKTWTTTDKEQYIVGDLDGLRTYGTLVPKSKLRVIKEVEHNGMMFRYCEIKGKITNQERPDFFYHSFAWICEEKI